MTSLIGKTATYNNLLCKVIDVFQGKTKLVAKVVYATVQSGSESVYIVWGTKQYSICVENLSFDQ